MKLTFLGTGTSQGVPVVACNCAVCRSTDEHDKRLRASVLLSVDGKEFLIDAGPDFRQQMLRIHQQRLNALLLTHEHTDHIFGLDDIRAFNWVQKRPMDIYAEERVQENLKRVFNYVFAANKYPGIPQMKLHTIENRPFCIETIEIIPIRGMHYRLPVFGFRVGDVAYLTDMNYLSPVEIEKLKGVKVLVVNSLRKEKHLSHFNLEQALELIHKVKPDRAYLTHISHMMGKQADVEPELPASVKMAYDGLVVSI